MLCRKWGGRGRGAASGPGGAQSTSWSLSREPCDLDFTNSSRTTCTQRWGQEFCLPNRAQLAQRDHLTCFSARPGGSRVITFPLLRPIKPLGSFPTSNTDDLQVDLGNRSVWFAQWYYKTFCLFCKILLGVQQCRREARLSPGMCVPPWSYHSAAAQPWSSSSWKLV